MFWFLKVSVSDLVTTFIYAMLGSGLGGCGWIFAGVLVFCLLWSLIICCWWCCFFLFCFLWYFWFAFWLL